MATVAMCSRFLLQKSAQGFLFSSRAVPAFSSPFLSRAHRLEPSDDELYQRTTVSVMKKEEDGGLLIHSYSTTGFNIDGNRVFGPCAVLPPAILQWKVGSSKDITEESVSLFHMLEPKIEILVLGTGTRLERIDPSVLALLKRKGIAVEVQDTPNACATFNFLVSERRIVAAGLIPPSHSTALEVKQE
ncbi:NADH dehydrogenase [ubiquinone] 1 alpha subcomplex assembly factor 3 [Archocentrus centrarchus]|uniref:NADH dehydrogenase [ubiquinone] 1 alpha subcomplex assembly factor 3 n=1 Tax=Archocentrus centrarchus TaxID=63155 RepID=UPI0011E9C860|nr:NADH dehydrogenase [ubiquinone] 1 alpha subcomplex assembly factor 3 [Archocentrus centrarchus]XP_030584524.1 NADH dehydrogenase [ubiquinone] 1 alpha subcomplex assembly factor 3 [Archocentrus centrarchus]